jgi:phosphomannomutase
MIDDLAGFDRVIRCKIGSPHVIAAMQDVLRAAPAAPVVGFEANGGFLLGFAADVTNEGGGILPRHAPLPALMTRDAALPLIAPLAAARAAGQSLSQMLAALPPRATAADRLQNIPPAASAALLAQLMDPAARTAYLAALGEHSTGENLTDGLRLHLKGGRILHLRASGNAPELRIYTEAQTAAAAQALLARAMAHTRASLAAPPLAQTTAGPTRKANA